MNWEDLWPDLSFTVENEIGSLHFKLNIMNGVVGNKAKA